MKPSSRQVQVTKTVSSLTRYIAALAGGARAAGHPPTRYTLEMLQAEARRWSGDLANRGFNLPGEIEAFTSSVLFEKAIGSSPTDEGEILGRADLTPDGRAVVFVRLPKAGRFEHDPLEVLIHELLHHVNPPLPHEAVDRLAKVFRREDEKALLPPYKPWSDPWKTEDRGAWQGELSEEAADDVINHFWLEANGLIRHPPRSSLTGRFVRRGGQT